MSRAIAVDVSLNLLPIAPPMAFSFCPAAVRPAPSMIVRRFRIPFRLPSDSTMLCKELAKVFMLPMYLATPSPKVRTEAARDSTLPAALSADACITSSRVSTVSVGISYHLRCITSGSAAVACRTWSSTHSASRSAHAVSAPFPLQSPRLSSGRYPAVSPNISSAAFPSC